MILCDGAGTAWHVVLRVDTERGNYVVDSQFDVIFDDDSGAPIPIEKITRDVIEAKIAESISNGSQTAADYDFEKYTYNNVYSIDWNKNRVFQALRAVVKPFVGDSEIKLQTMPRPYVAEEPALMVAILCAMAALPAGFVLALRSTIRWWRRQRMKSKTPAGTTPTPANDADAATELDGQDSDALASNWTA